jgi:hypothetical protein
MAQTVSECLTAATDSVTVINDINSNGLSSKHITASDPSAGITQADANARVKANVDHLTTILAYDGTHLMLKTQVTISHLTLQRLLLVIHIFLTIARRSHGFFNLDIIHRSSWIDWFEIG